MIRGLKSPMVRGSNGFVQLQDDDLIENIVQFFVGTYANNIGIAGECRWDHRFGTPIEGLRHRNIRAGILEWFASVMASRTNGYMGDIARVVAVERYVEGTRVFLRVIWRNKQTNEERPTDVQFPS